jgi:iron complex transport system permease protein
MGDLSRVRLNGALFALASVSVLVFLIWSRWRDLDALLLGEETAAALGIPVHGVRRRMVLWISLLIGICVSGGGMIGFVGLVVPHFVRRLVGSLHLHLIPLVAIWGATCLTLADAVARSVVSPMELPVGVVTALIGAPVFIFILTSRSREAA